MHLLYIITYTQYTYYIYIHYLEIHTQYLCSLCIAYTLEIGVVLDFADLLKDNLLEAVALHRLQTHSAFGPNAMCTVLVADYTHVLRGTWWRWQICISYLVEQCWNIDRICGLQLMDADGAILSKAYLLYPIVSYSSFSLVAITFHWDSKRTVESPNGSAKLSSLAAQTAQTMSCLFVGRGHYMRPC